MPEPTDAARADGPRPDGDPAGSPAGVTASGRERGGLGRAAALVGSGVLLGVAGAVLALHAHTQTQTRTLVAPNPVGDRIPAAAAPSAFAPPVVAGHLVPLRQHVPPVEVAAPTVGVRSTLVGLRLNTDGSLQVPTDYAKAGWYSQGPAPGDVGQPAVIVGHVDSTAGPAVFFRLRELKTGDAVLVRRADGTTVTFVVYAAAQYPKTAFPARLVYGSNPDAELRMITCTGDFDRATGHYLGNYVVYARERAAR